MSANAGDEWGLIQKLLPDGWEAAAQECGAFRRLRYTKSPGDLLRLLLFHAVSDGGLRSTIAQAKMAGITTMSPVALHKRMRTSMRWLEWIAAELCRRWREQPRTPKALRPRVIDSTTIRGPASTQTDWRLHFMLDLPTLACDWHLLTDATVGEALQDAPLREGDVVLGDRNYLRVKAIQAALRRKAHVLMRMRWKHARMHRNGKRFVALSAVRRLRVGQIGEWEVELPVTGDAPIAARIVATKLPAPVARKAQERSRRIARRKCKKLDDRTLQAAHFVIVFTTLSAEQLDAAGVLELYRYRWQVEVAFKRLKQLLRLGRVPHKDQEVARSWILAKLVVALLLETMYRNARSFFPWGYPLEEKASEAVFIPA